MAKRVYGQLEEYIIALFERDREFVMGQKRYVVMFARKPRPQTGGGECKTDVFVRAKEQTTGQVTDLKLSVKNENKEFMGNKLKKEDVEAYLGPQWEKILMKATTSLKETFESRVLLYASGKYPTKPNSVTVGWKLEIADRPRALSARIPLEDRQIRDYVYKGTNLAEEKKNSVVNHQVIADSGVADHLITTSMGKLASAQDVIRQMEPIDSADIGETYFIFTANNYRTDVDSADGKRYLAVWVKWQCIGGRLVPEFHYDRPLQYNGETDMAPYVKAALGELGKKNVSELIPSVDVDAGLFMY